MSKLLSLPDEILKLVLQHVPLRDRLTSCCLVHSRFHAAAVAGASALALADFTPVRSQERADSVLGWLDQYGEHLTSLKITEFPKPLLHLPCPNLLELSLGEGCTVQLAPSAAEDGSPGVMQNCSKLTRLDLECNFSDTQKATPVLDCLSSLVDLQHLVLSPTQRESTALAGSTLPPFPELTTLTASCMDVGFFDNLAHSSSLLQLYVLPSPGEVTVGPREMPLDLPASLTKLSLHCQIEVGLLSLVPETLRELNIDGAVEGHAEPFLSGIARLQHLSALLLESLDGLAWPGPGPAYNALTASSNLVSLTLQELNLAEGVVPYIFPAVHKLPHLTSVCIGDDVDTDDVDTGADGATPAWSPADLSSLIECCPNLSEIDRVFLQTGPHVSELHKLTALTRLNVVFVPGGLSAYEESLQGLAAVTQLRELAFETTRNNLNVGSLLSLTSLTALTSLSCEWEASADPKAPAGADPEAAVEDTRVTFESQGDGVLPVWVRLLLRCSGCNPQALAQLEQQLAGPDAVAVHMGVTFDQQQQLSVHHQRLSAQRQYIVQQVQQIQDLQKQLAIHSATTARQAEQVTRLTAQYATHQQVVQQVAAQQAVRIKTLRDQLTAQEQAAEQQRQVAAQHDARIAALHGQMDAQVQTAVQNHQLLMAQQQQQLHIQRLVMGRQSTQITALEGQLQAMQATLQEVLQRQQQQ